MTFYLILIYAAFLLSLLGTRIAILTSRKRPPFLDHRGQLQKPIPTGGGLVVVMTLIICLLVADINYGIILAMFLLAAVSLLAELIPISTTVKLLVYMLAVLIPVSVMNEPVLGGLLPLWVDKTLTVLLWVWLIHVFNVMDGIDGITPTETISIAGGLALILAINGAFPNPLAVYSLVVMAAACGFFWWNWYPAKILLGEAGSAPIGFLLGYLLLVAIASGYGAAAAILPAYYLCDAIFTPLRRLYQGKKMLEQHHEHYYQLAVLGGRRHDAVVRYIFGINLLLIFLATFAVLNPELGIICVATAYMGTFMMLGFFAYTPHNPDYEPF